MAPFIIAAIVILLVVATSVALWWWKISARIAPYEDEKARQARSRPPRDEEVVIVPTRKS